MHVNEYSYLGEVLLDLKKVRHADLAFVKPGVVEYELKRIRENLFRVWSENQKGLAYYLEFHYNEGLRLHGSIDSAEMETGTAGSPPKDFYTLKCTVINMTIFYGLRDILADIKGMRGESEIHDIG